MDRLATLTVLVAACAWKTRDASFVGIRLITYL